MMVRQERSTLMKLFITFILGSIFGVSIVFGYLGYRHLSEPSQNSKLAFNTPQIVFGEEKAPIQVIEYSSLGCPACSGFKVNVWPVIKNKYLDSGDVRWIWRHFPLADLDLKAAMLVHCSKDPKTLSFNLYKKQREWLLSQDPLEEIKKIARNHHMSNEAIESCWKDEHLLNSMIHMRIQAGHTQGINATPALIIGKTVIHGAISLKELDHILQTAQAHVASGKSIEQFEMPNNRPIKEEKPKENPALKSDQKNL